MFRLEKAIETIDVLNARIQAQQLLESRLKKQLADEKERIKNSKAEAEGLMTLLVLAEENIEQARAMSATLKLNVDRYRGWWLTEYYSLRAITALLPADQMEDVSHIVQSAHSRFESFTSTD